MALGSLFRQEAIDHQSTREPIDRLAQVTLPYDWLVLLLIAAVCLFIAIWSVLVKIDLTLPVDVMLIKPTDDRTVASPVSAQVSDVFVTVGSQVNEGDALVRIVLPELRRRLGEANTRERVLREAMGLRGINSADLNRMLIETRAESAALTIALENHEVIVSPFAGEVVDVTVATGQVATMGEDVLRVRVGEAADPFAVAFVPPSRIDTVPINAAATIQCPRPLGVERVGTHEISHLPENLVASDLIQEAGIDPSDLQLRVTLTNATAITHGTLCTGRILLDSRTPFQILLGKTRGLGNRG